MSSIPAFSCCNADRKKQTASDHPRRTRPLGRSTTKDTNLQARSSSLLLSWSPSPCPLVTRLRHLFACRAVTTLWIPIDVDRKTNHAATPLLQRRQDPARRRECFQPTVGTIVTRRNVIRHAARTGLQVTFFQLLQLVAITRRAELPIEHEPRARHGKKRLSQGRKQLRRPDVARDAGDMKMTIDRAVAIEHHARLAEIAQTKPCTKHGLHERLLDVADGDAGIVARRDRQIRWIVDGRSLEHSWRQLARRRTVGNDRRQRWRLFRLATYHPWLERTLAPGRLGRALLDRRRSFRPARELLPARRLPLLGSGFWLLRCSGSFYRDGSFRPLASPSIVFSAFSSGPNTSSSSPRNLAALLSIKLLAALSIARSNGCSSNTSFPRATSPTKPPLFCHRLSPGSKYSACSGGFPSLRASLFRTTYPSRFDFILVNFGFGRFAVIVILRRWLVDFTFG